jgi:Centromere protein H (CENP-H).
MLNAVHHATYSSPLERYGNFLTFLIYSQSLLLMTHRDLLPYTQQRDAIAMETALSCSNLEEAKRQLADLETNVLRTSHNNMMLASELLKVASKGQPHNPSRKFERANVEITKLEEEVKSSYYRWKIMKGAAVAVVAGSGVDWVRNEHLRNVVLDIQD